MKHIKISLRNLSFLFAFSLLITSCDDFELPDTGSIPDVTPPAADFSYEQNEADWKQVDFANLSISATDYLWDFGGGNTTTDANPSFTYDTIGTYSVTLTATDKLNQTSTFTDQVVVEEPVIVFTPEILNPGFEDGTDNWIYEPLNRSGSFGGPQITSSPVHEGAKAGKFPTSNERHIYQLISVLPNTNYRLSFYYTMKTSPVGTLTVSVLGGEVTDRADIAAATLNTVTLNDQSSASTYVSEYFLFNSGNNSQIAIYAENQDVECRIDAFTIVEE